MNIKKKIKNTISGVSSALMFAVFILVLIVMSYITAGAISSFTASVNKQYEESYWSNVYYVDTGIHYDRNITMLKISDTTPNNLIIQEPDKYKIVQFSEFRKIVDSNPGGQLSLVDFKIDKRFSPDEHEHYFMYIIDNNIYFTKYASPTTTLSELLSYDCIITVVNNTVYYKIPKSAVSESFIKSLKLEYKVTGN